MFCSSLRSAFHSIAFVLEEKIMSRTLSNPLLSPLDTKHVWRHHNNDRYAFPALLYRFHSRGRGGYFDMSAGLYQILSVPAVLASSIAICFTIAFFNFFGFLVTSNVSATARSTIDTCRTLGIWIVSLTLGWENVPIAVGSLQVLGFVLLVYGTFLFNGIVSPPLSAAQRG